MSIYDTLNEEQKKAVFATEGPLLCLAGAGSGKTRMLTHRVAYLIEKGTAPYNIMAITFTNKAAGEMKDRVDKLVGEDSDGIWITTFHSSCVRILRRYADRIGFENNFSIYDTDDSKSVMRDICKRFNVDTRILRERAILSEISSAKDELIDEMEYKSLSSGDYRRSKIADCYVEYQKVLKSNNAMDFDDLIMKTVELFKKVPEVLDAYQKRFKYIMVDEYQDTNTAQFELVRLLANGFKNLCVVGDDDQSIYKFRGANIRNILDFEHYYPEALVIRLEQNYRSTGIILDAANSVIKNNRGRKDKSLWTDKEDGERIHLRQFDTAYEEAGFIASEVARKGKRSEGGYSDFAVLYRTNAQSRLLEEKFVYEGLPYKVVGGVNFYSRKEIKDILAYLRTIDNARDDIQVKRIINVPKRGIGAATINKVQEYADMSGISFFDALSEAESIPSIGKAAGKLTAFVSMIRVFRSKSEVMGLDKLIRDITDTTDYLSEFDGETDEEIDSRIENIEELINKAVAFAEATPGGTLNDFLNEVSLVADIDELTDDIPRALLMTIHSAKGLEFENVYLAGMEDGLFPSEMTITSDDTQELEEERRLAYVGITRAKSSLTLCYAKSRMVRGETRYNAVSRFVREIPEQLMDNRIEKPRYADVYPKSSSYGEETASYGRKKPVAVLKRGTDEEVKPFITGGGLGSLASLGVTRGMPGASDTGAVKGGKPDYDIGDRVRHIKFGEGTVTDLEPGPRDYKVTVDFDDAGTKVMYALFAKLEKI